MYCTVLTKFYRMSPWMTSESAYEVQERLWGELLDKLEEISPGVRQNI